MNQLSNMGMTGSYYAQQQAQAAYNIQLAQDQFQQRALNTQISLRDQIAIGALNTLLTQYNNVDPTWVAEQAYMFADAMINVRNAIKTKEVEIAPGTTATQIELKDE